MKKINNISDLEKLKEEGLRSLYPEEMKINVGMSTCGCATGAKGVYQAILDETAKGDIKPKITMTGCIGLCHAEPIIDIRMPKSPRITYGGVKPQDVTNILKEASSGKVSSKAIGRTEEDKFPISGFTKRLASDGKSQQGLSSVPLINTSPFYNKQVKIAMRNCGIIDPDNIAEYIARDGYFPLARVLKEKKPDGVISEVEKSGIRGRGGAGFPTGRKWAVARKAQGETKYVICNADEGDPGAYMDRSILEGDPHAVIEGMMIAAYAIGASQGYIYVRSEYPIAIEKLEIALKTARESGLLGKGIMGTGFDFDIKIAQGAGAFVCGEETALIRSIEGNWGEPKQRPPYPAIAGLWGMPTVINNVETLANIPAIIAKGSEWFSSMGTKGSKGTKVFSLVGKIKNVGLVEVPMGITLNEIIFDIGGGIPKNKKVKAVQTGGPSGGCIPADMLNLPIDYDELKKAGSIMGSGGMVVMDEDTCMVDVAKYFLGYLEDESCGKCVPCRVGVRKMREIVEDITKGNGTAGDIGLLEEMAKSIKDGSFCNLGATAPNPVLTTLQYFRNEYEAHIDGKKCPAGVCKELIKYRIEPNICIACGKCISACPVDAITGEKKKPHVIDIGKCIKCAACKEICPVDAVVTK